MLDNSVEEVQNNFMKHTLFLCILIIVFVITPRVTAQEVRVDKIVFPPISSGPGYILPDSPFYSVDKIYQRVRLALIFSADNRARMHNQIAGERLAELRVMTARDHQEGVDKALSELSWELDSATTELNDAKAQGKEVKELAIEINQSIAQKKVSLESVAQQVIGTAFEQKLLAVVASLREVKVFAEEALPEAEREQELALSTEEELENAVLGVSSSAAKLEKKLALYEKHASKAAEKRAELEASKVINERQLQQMRIQLEKLKSERQKRIEEMRVTIRNAEAAAQKFKEARRAEIEFIKNNNASISASTPQI